MLLDPFSSGESYTKETVLGNILKTVFSTQSLLA